MPNISLSQSPLETRRMIVLSTAHLSKGTAQSHSTYREDASLWPIPYGYLCWMWDSHDLVNEKEIPQDLRLALEGLQKHYGAQEGDYIRFDADGPILRRIPTYPW